MKGDTDILLDQAEMEYGPKMAWAGWIVETGILDDMFAPYDLGEREALCLESADDEWDYNDIEPPQKSRLFVPPGMIVWMECNHPGRVYISDRANKDWSDYNGYAPCEITWELALALLTSGEGHGPWNLEVCGPLPEGCKAEMEEICGKMP